MKSHVTKHKVRYSIAASVLIIGALLSIVKDDMTIFFFSEAVVLLIVYTRFLYEKS